MSALHVAFSEVRGTTLSRLDELLALLESNLDADTFDQAKQLLMATVDPLVSSRMHEAAAAEAEAEETRRPERKPETPTPANVSRETSSASAAHNGRPESERAGPPSARDNHRTPPRRS